jgi:hypothetical protein
MQISRRLQVLTKFGVVLLMAACVLICPARGRADEWCINVLGQLASGQHGLGEVKIRITINGKPCDVTVNLTQIKSETESHRGRAESFIRVAYELRKKVMEQCYNIPPNKEDEKKVGKIRNGYVFSIEADKVEVLMDGAVRDKDGKIAIDKKGEPIQDLRVQAMKGPCPGIFGWETQEELPLSTGRTPQGEPLLGFKEEESILRPTGTQKNGDFVVCVTLFNRTGRDLTFQKLTPDDSIVVMLNWTFPNSPEPSSTPGLAGEPNDPNDPAFKDPNKKAAFAKVKGVTIPKADPNAPDKDENLPSQGNAAITQNKMRGTLKICWTIKGDLWPEKLYGFDLCRKYLVYLDFIGLPMGLLPRSQNFWVRPIALQNGGTRVGYNWFPTNPAFSTAPRRMQFEVDTVSTVLPAGWQLTFVPPSTSNEIGLDVEEMHTGMFFLDVPPNPPPGTTAHVVIKGTDVQTGETIMRDLTEVVSAPDGADVTPPFCNLTAFMPGSPNTAQLTVQDLGSGLATINVLDTINANVTVPAFNLGTTETVMVSANPIDSTQFSYVLLELIDTAGNVTCCDQELSCAADVSSQIRVVRGGFNYQRSTRRYLQRVTLKNTGSSTIRRRLSLVLDSLSSNASLVNLSGQTVCGLPLGSPYLDFDLGVTGELAPGDSAEATLEFTNPSNMGITYNTRMLGGAGVR